jgi:hypothetical protein
MEHGQTEFQYPAGRSLVSLYPPEQNLEKVANAEEMPTSRVFKRVDLVCVRLREESTMLPIALYPSGV